MPERAVAAGGGPSTAAAPSPGSDRSAAPTALQVLRALDSGPRGLTEGAAEDRLARFGENVLPTQRVTPWPRRLLLGLRDPFTAVLLVLGLVSAAVASWATAAVITFLVVVSCGLRISGELRADRSMAHLRELVATTASVLRRADSRDAAPVVREIPVDQLVPGDVISLGPGDLVPADVRTPVRPTGARDNSGQSRRGSARTLRRPRHAPEGGVPRRDCASG